jgi:hypothetical protein
MVLTASLAASPASAQSSATETCTSTDYLAPIVALSNSLGTLDYTKLDTVGSALTSLITLRNEYEDLPPAAGCESLKPALIQFLALREDVIFAQVASKVDAANIADYKDVVTTGAGRFQTVGKLVNDAITPLTFPDKMPTALAGTAVPTSAPEVCSDAAFIAELAPAQSTIGAIKGMNIAAVIKLRYQFEDLQAVTGCGDAQTVLIQLITNVEDMVTLGVMSTADAAHAAAYTKFTSSVVAPRTATLQKLYLAAFPAAKATPTK